MAFFAGIFQELSKVSIKVAFVEFLILIPISVACVRVELLGEYLD